MHILQVSTSDFAGGAEGTAWRLFQAYRMLGHQSWLAVGMKHTHDENVLVIPNNQKVSSWAHLWLACGNIILPPHLKQHGAEIIRRSIQNIPVYPIRMVRTALGIEDFDFPGTRSLLNLTQHRPDILHCHNLHGHYFDLRALPELSAKVPTILNLRDAWLLGGHCAHSFDCERWKSGCGHCPDLSIPNSIRHDASAYNWRRKKNIFSRSRVFVTTPSQWLMDKVERSMLTPSIIERRVIPNGVDLSIFQPDERSKARAALGLPENVNIVLFAANGIRANIWKDYLTMRRAIGLISEKMADVKLLFLALGENAPDERVGSATIRFVPHQRDMRMVARYYQAADIYIHAAKADTFPNTVLEALACGIPVVATDVGGIPEQINQGKTGFLTPLGNAPAMAEAIQRLLEDPDLRQRMGQVALNEANKKFGLNLQARRFLRWYDEIISNWK